MTGCRLFRSLTVVAATILSPGLARSADAAAVADSQTPCGRGERWDVGMGMCMPGPDPMVTSTVLAARFNAFGVWSALQGPRGVDQFAAPNWFMIEATRSVDARQVIGIDFMGTAELWTYPWHGYPELLQVGEERSDGSAYVDAQHPHSSPIMGLTFSDTISLAGDRLLELSFAPRGESTDGPIAYLHRASARDNPDAPLGHHVAQDVGHISSTVLAARLTTGRWTIEISAFNGTEPEPMQVDLPLGSPDSAALRLGYATSPDHRVMASVAHVRQTDATYPGTTSATRLSASIYDQFKLPGPWTADHSLVIGSMHRHPDGAPLASFLDELTVSNGPSALWGRLELLQRLASELRIPVTSPVTPAEDKRWVSALTIGYTHWMRERHHIEFAIGSSLTADVVPNAWEMTYGSRVPLTVRVIFQVRGAGHWRE